MPGNALRPTTTTTTTATVTTATTATTSTAAIIGTPATNSLASVLYYRSLTSTSGAAATTASATSSFQVASAKSIALSGPMQANFAREQPLPIYYDYYDYYYDSYSYAHFYDDDDFYDDLHCRTKVVGRSEIGRNEIGRNELGRNEPRTKRDWTKRVGRNELGRNEPDETILGRIELVSLTSLGLAFD